MSGFNNQCLGSFPHLHRKETSSNVTSWGQKQIEYFLQNITQSTLKYNVIMHFSIIRVLCKGQNKYRVIIKLEA